MSGEPGALHEPVIVVRQQRPSYYPDIYVGKAWSWSRQRYLYEVHAVNRLEYLDLNSIRGRLRWWVFRLRLSLETIKWLRYAVVRKKKEMLASSSKSETQYDLWPWRVFRRSLQMTISTNNRRSC